MTWNVDQSGSTRHVLLNSSRKWLSAASGPRTIRPGAIQRKSGESLRSSPTALRSCAFYAETNLLNAPLISSFGAAHRGLIASVATAARATRVAARCERMTFHLQRRVNGSSGRSIDTMRANRQHCRLLACRSTQMATIRARPRVLQKSRASTMPGRPRLACLVGVSFAPQTRRRPRLPRSPRHASACPRSMCVGFARTPQ